MLKAVGSKKNLLESPFYACVADMLQNEDILKLDRYTHHIHTTRLQHSLNVAYYNYIICRFFHLNAVSAARAGLLHDMFYYDRHEYSKKNGGKSHFSRHPEIALENARAHFSIDALESDMIEKHMWPVSIRNVPKYKESCVIVFVDKYCAVMELLAYRYRIIFKKSQ